MESSPPQGGGGGGSSPAPFLVKTYDMVEDPATDDVVSWGPSNASFVVWNPPDFSRDLLPKYFKHNNFSSFIRQLNTYGFRKIDPERWEFANEGFIRGQTHLLKNIHRRKPVHSHSLQNQGNVPLAESERRELEEEIDRLKYEKTVLLEDLQRHTQQQYGLNWHIRSLEERLRVMEERQTNLIASLGQILQSHGFVSSFLWEPDHFSKKRRVPKVDFFDGDTAIKEHQIEHSQSIFPMHPTNTEPPDRMELSLVSLEKLFQAANHASGEDMYHGATASRHPSMVLTDLQSPASLHLSSQQVGDIHSSSELADSPSYMDSPVLPLAEIDEDDTCKAAEADVSSHAATSETSQDGTVDTRASDEPTRVNDLFWERFLTDTQQSGDTCGAQSDKQDGEVKAETTEEKMERSIGVQGSRFFHNRNNVDQIIEKMGHLTPAENA